MGHFKLMMKKIETGPNKNTGPINCKHKIFLVKLCDESSQNVYLSNHVNDFT